MREIADASQLLVKVRLVKMTGPGTRNTGMNSNLNLKLEARSESVAVTSRRSSERIEPSLAHSNVRCCL